MTIKDASFKEYRATVTGFNEGGMPLLAWTTNPSLQMHRYRELVPDVLYARESVARRLDGIAFRSAVDLKEAVAISKYFQEFLLTGVNAHRAFHNCDLNTAWESLLLTQIWKINHQICYLEPDCGHGWVSTSVIVCHEHLHPEALREVTTWPFHYAVRVQCESDRFFIIDSSLKYPVEYKAWISECFQRPSPKVIVYWRKHKLTDLCYNPSGDNKRFTAFSNLLTDQDVSGSIVTEPVTSDQPFFQSRTDPLDSYQAMLYSPEVQVYKGPRHGTIGEAIIGEIRQKLKQIDQSLDIQEDPSSDNYVILGDCLISQKDLQKIVMPINGCKYFQPKVLPQRTAEGNYLVSLDSCR